MIYFSLERAELCLYGMNLSYRPSPIVIFAEPIKQQNKKTTAKKIKDRLILLCQKNQMNYEYRPSYGIVEMPFPCLD